VRAVAVVLVSLSIFGVAACGDDGSEATRPQGATETTIDAPGGEIDAVEMGDGPVGVVLAHGASTTKELWYPLMPALADAGMHAVAFDFGSDREGDIRAAMSYLQDAGAEKIVLIGSSLGGSNVLDVATGDSVAAVVTFSVGDGGAWSIDEPGLYIASEGDGGTADAARALADRFDGKAVVVDGSTHGADLLKPHPEVIAEVVTFIESATTQA
jgi:hypothetical protein